MAFDFAIGMQGSQLDAISANLYQHLYPKLFSGSQQQEYAGVKYTVSWDIRTPARFDLANTADAQAALATHLSAHDPAGESHSPELIELAAASVAAFTFTYQTVDIKLTSPGVPEAALQLQLTAQAKMLVNGDGSQSIDVYALSTPTQPDPVQDWLVQNVVLPRILASAQTIFGGVSIPPLQMPGVQLTAPVTFVQDGALIAIANLTASGPPPVPAPGSVPWPSDAFFVLLGNNALQQATAYNIANSSNSRSDSGKHGSHWAGDSWSYSLAIVDPHVRIDGTNLDFTANIAGSISASVYIVYLPIGVGFTAFAKPNPSATLALQVSGSSLVVKTKHVNPFVLLVVPSGSVSERITAAMLEPIAAAVVASFSPFISQFLGGIDFTSFAIPSYRIAVGTTTVTASPNGVAVSNVAGMLALTGEMSITT
jgi:hypothetical protein